MIVLLSTNLHSFNLPILRKVAHEILGLDLSLNDNEKPEAYQTLLKMKRGSPVPLKKHIIFTFLIASPFEETLELYEMLDGMGISSWTARNGDLLMSTGSLEDWVRVILRYNVGVPPLYVSKILSSVQDQLEKLGLSSLFSDYHKLKNAEGTYILERD